MIVDSGSDPLLDASSSDWMEILHLTAGPGITLSTLADAQLMAGDAELNLLHEYVERDLPRVDEQIDKSSGAQISAQSLTWSYANILHAMKVGKAVEQMKRNVRTILKK